MTPAYSVLFLLFIIGFIFLPGLAFCSAVRLRVFSDRLVAASTYLTAGIAIFTILYLLVRYLQLPVILLWALPCLSVPAFFSLRKSLYFVHHPRRMPVILGIILLGVLAQSIFLSSGGNIRNDGVYFPEIHDTMWNIAIIEKILLHVPPEHPALSGTPLRNNHYFYPALLAGMHQLTHIPVLDLYYRLGPVFVSLLFGCSLYTVSTIFTRRPAIRAVCVTLGYFSGNASFLLLLVKEKGFNWQGNTFFSDQPFDQIMNPYSVLGFLFILMFGYCFSRVFLANTIRWNWFGVSMLLLCVMYGYKSFSGVLAIAALTLTILFLTAYTRKVTYAALLVASWMVFIPSFLIISDPGVSRMHWVPGWILTEMIIGKDKVNMPEYAQSIATYRMGADWFGYASVLRMPFVLYTIGNFGIRCIGAVWLLINVVRAGKTDKKVASVFYCIVLTIGFLLPLFFNLGYSTFNIIQFTPYALLIAAIMTGLGLEYIFRLFSVRSMKIFGAGVVTVLIMLSLPTTGKTIHERIRRNPEKIPLSHIEALQYVRKNIQPGDMVATFPNDDSVHPIHIPALSGASMYFADAGYVTQTGNSPEDRQRLMEGISDGTVPLSHLRPEGVKYLYLVRSAISNHLAEEVSSEQTREVFKNSDIVIYKL